MLLTSLQNRRIKDIRALTLRRERQKTGLFFVEGIRLVGEAIQTFSKIETLVVVPNQLQSHFGKKLVDRARSEQIEVLEVSEAVFHKLSNRDGPQGIGAVVKQDWTDLKTVKPDVGLGWVVLEEVGDAGNLGAILRTGDAVGLAGIILLGDTTDPYNPQSVRSSMGSIFSQMIIRTSLEKLVMWKEQFMVPMIGTSDSATIDYRHARYFPPLLLSLGSEKKGLSKGNFDVCETVVRIPMVGRADSLNLAVSAGILLYDVYNRQSIVDE